MTRPDKNKDAGEPNEELRCTECGEIQRQGTLLPPLIECDKCGAEMCDNCAEDHSCQ